MEFSLAHRTLPLPPTQRICNQSRTQRDGTRRLVLAWVTTSLRERNHSILADLRRNRPVRDATPELTIEFSFAIVSKRLDVYVEKVVRMLLMVRESS